jgi:hypothetical protein
MTAMRQYGPQGPFAAQRLFLPHPPFSRALNFLTRNELAKAERVCRSWRAFIEESNQWKNQSQILFKIPQNQDPMPYFWFISKSYKKNLQRVLSRVIAARFYEFYLGAKVPPAPPIPEAISLKTFSQQDPAGYCLKGQEYLWVYSPPYFDITVDADSPLHLHRTRLIERKPTIGERWGQLIRKKRVLRVPNTVHNLYELCLRPKQGSPLKHRFLKEMVEENLQEIPSGWFLIREDVIERGRTFAHQQATAKKRGVVISQLQERILFNFVRAVQKEGIYPDAKGQVNNVRTSTVSYGNFLSLSSYGGSDDERLQLRVSRFPPMDRDWAGGAAVNLPS